jgi:hypothetical protein
VIRHDFLDSGPRLPLVGPIQLATERGVYSYQEPSGEVVSYAVTSRGDLLNGELRRRYPDETAAMVVASVWRDLNRQDPIPIHPRLAYVNGEEHRPVVYLPQRPVLARPRHQARR